MKQMKGIDGYPCQWPVGWHRTENRKRSRYEVPFGQARDGVFNALRLLGATEAVISSNIPVRHDGLPYATYAEPRDPSVAIYWVYKGKPQVMACDQWKTVRENLRAIGLALDGLRAVERSGASQIFERAFVGFAALPASTKRPWRQVLQLNGGPISRELVDSVYRTRAKFLHPDVPGGSEVLMTELNVAKAEAYKELGL